ncbi:MAG: electron transfer flavoprotein subunit alpha/FixB family protein [Chloroflexota bacterium]|nr:electron transfer flavoprotein subunit alpha/FixB family protein [Chloroflexota bacterium]
MADNNGVLVCGEVAEGKLLAITLELLGGGRKLADELGESLSIALIGSGVKDLAQEAIAFGADKVYVVDDAALKDYQTDSYAAAMDAVVKSANPRALVLGQTSMGRDLAPKMGFKLKTGVSMDCIELSIDPSSKALLQTRPVYGGNARAIFSTGGMPQIATVRSKAMSALERDDSRKGDVVPIEGAVDAAAARIKVVSTVKEEVEGVKLEDAAVIVTGGRGLGGPEGFQELEKLAKTMKGAVGATRPPCDNGWVPAAIQIGLTGKIVSPDVYFAVALSGSSQHMAGCSGSKTIIAINRDPEANIFKEAQFGVVGDWKQVMPPLTEKIKELLAG